MLSARGSTSRGRPCRQARPSSFARRGFLAGPAAMRWKRKGRKRVSWTKYPPGNRCSPVEVRVGAGSIWRPITALDGGCRSRVRARRYGRTQHDDNGRNSARWLIASSRKSTTSRGGAIAVGITVAVIAAILLIVYISRYKSSVDSTASAVPVLVAKNLIPKGTSGTTVATKGRYQSTSVPSDKRSARGDQRSECAQRPTRGLRHLSRRAADHEQLLGRGINGAQRAAHRP